MSAKKIAKKEVAPKPSDEETVIKDEISPEPNPPDEEGSDPAILDEPAPDVTAPPFKTKMRVLSVTPLGKSIEKVQMVQIDPIITDISDPDYRAPSGALNIDIGDPNIRGTIQIGDIFKISFELVHAE